MSDESPDHDDASGPDDDRLPWDRPAPVIDGNDPEVRAALERIPQTRWRRPPVRLPIRGADTTRQPSP